MSECNENHHGVRTEVRHLLHDDGIVEKVGTRTAVRRRCVGSQVPLGPRPPPGLAVAHAAAVPVGNFGFDFLLRETAELFAKQLVLFVEDVTSH